MSKSILFAAALIMGAIVMPASATVNQEIINKQVQYSDLDLSKTAGQTTLYKRLKKAAKNVCSVGSHRYTRSLVDYMEGKSCYQTTLTTAVQQIGNAGLSDMHKSS